MGQRELIENVIKAIQEQKNKDIEQKDKEIEGFERILQLLIEYDGTKKLTEGDIKQIQTVTCSEDISMCCGIAKNCLFRNCALEMLGISQQKYQKEKSALVQKWVRDTIKMKEMKND